MKQNPKRPNCFKIYLTTSKNGSWKAFIIQKYPEPNVIKFREQRFPLAHDLAVVWLECRRWRLYPSHSQTTLPFQNTYATAIGDTKSIAVRLHY